MLRVRRNWRPLLTLGVLLLMVGLSRPARAFLSDLTGHWSASVVTALEARGIVAGMEPDTFLPDAPLTRAQMAKLFVVSLGHETGAEQIGRHTSRFADVPHWHWANGYIELMAELGLTAGVSPDRFDPEAPVTRAQLALFTVRSAGLADQVAAQSGVATGYTDDAAIPDWARGAVVTAQTEGLMQGLPGGQFEPDRPVTRAEGSAVLYRLLNRRGALFHLAGTLVQFDPATRKGIVRNALGDERPLRMSRDASYMRQGVAVPAAEMRPLDQVWVALSPAGDALFMEAWYQDMLVERVTSQGGIVVLDLVDGRREVRRLQPGALLYVNGAEAPAEMVNGLTDAYAALDSTTGEVRLLAGLRSPRTGTLVDPWVDDFQAIVEFNGHEEELTWIDEPVIMINGTRAEINQLQPGDPLLLGFDEALRIAYVEVMR